MTFTRCIACYLSMHVWLGLHLWEPNIGHLATDASCSVRVRVRVNIGFGLESSLEISLPLYHPGPECFGPGGLAPRTRNIWTEVTVRTRLRDFPSLYVCLRVRLPHVITWFESFVECFLSQWHWPAAWSPQNFTYLKPWESTIYNNINILASKNGHIPDLVLTH